MSWTLIPASECTPIDLMGLKPQSNGMPAIGFNHMMLTDTASSQVLNWEEYPSDQLWAALPKMSWIQKVLIYQNLSKMNSEASASFQNFFKLSFEKVAVEFILKAGFQQFCHEKDLQAGDTNILKFASDDLISLFSFEKLQRFTKSEFTQIAELVIEIHQQEKMKVDELKQAFELNTLALIEVLKAKRFPMAAAQDSNKQLMLRKMTLGHGIQTKWLRLGDRAGIEVRFFVTQEKEFKKQLDQMTRLSSVLESEN